MAVWPGRRAACCDQSGSIILTREKNMLLNYGIRMLRGWDDVLSWHAVVSIGLTHTLTLMHEHEDTLNVYIGCAYTLLDVLRQRNPHKEFIVNYLSSLASWKDTEKTFFWERECLMRHIHSTVAGKEDRIFFRNVYDDQYPIRHETAIRYHYSTLDHKDEDIWKKSIPEDLIAAHSKRVFPQPF